MAKYAEYIFNGSNYIQVGGSEGGSVSSRLVVTATGSASSLTLSSTFSDILSAAQSGVDVVIEYANYIYDLEYFNSSTIWFRKMDHVANMNDDDFEGLVMERIVVTSNSAKIETDIKETPLVVTGNVVTNVTAAEGTYVDTDTTLASLNNAIDAKIPIEIRVIDISGAIVCYYFYERDDHNSITFRSHMEINHDSGFIYLNNSTVTPVSDNADGTLRCILRSHNTTLPIIPPVTNADSGKFLRVSSLGKWAAEAVPNAEEASF